MKTRMALSLILPLLGSACGSLSESSSTPQAKYIQSQPESTTFLWAHSIPVIQLQKTETDAVPIFDFVSCWYTAEYKTPETAITQELVKKLFINSAQPINSSYTSRNRAMRLLQAQDAMAILREAFYDRFGTSVFETELIKQLGLPGVTPHTTLPILERVNKERFEAFKQFVSALPYDQADFGMGRELRSQVEFFDRLIPRLPDFLQGHRERVRAALDEVFDRVLDHPHNCPTTPEAKRAAMTPFHQQ